MIRLQRGDITKVEVDVIVNAANEWMLGGGGVDSAIHEAAGLELLAACRAIPEVREGVRCPAGEARITPAFKLPAKFVIHTVGPVYRDRTLKRDGTPGEAASREPAQLLASAYRESLRLAAANGCKSIAFPAISCGVYGYPLEEAASIAIKTCQTHGVGLDIVFVLFSHEVYEIWRDVLAASDGKSADQR